MFSLLEIWWMYYAPKVCHKKEKFFRDSKKCEYERSFVPYTFFLIKWKFCQLSSIFLCKDSNLASSCSVIDKEQNFGNVVFCKFSFFSSSYFFASGSEKTILTQITTHPTESNRLSIRKKSFCFPICFFVTYFSLIAKKIAVLIWVRNHCGGFNRIFMHYYTTRISPPSDEKVSEALRTNKCDFVWEGIVKYRSFPQLKPKIFQNVSLVRDYLKRLNVEHYWDLAHAEAVLDSSDST